MKKCQVCGTCAIKLDNELCDNCREMEFAAEKIINTNPEKARTFFRDLVIKAGQTLRARSSMQKGGDWSRHMGFYSRPN